MSLEPVVVGIVAIQLQFHGVTITQKLGSPTEYYE